MHSYLFAKPAAPSIQFLAIQILYKQRWSSQKSYPVAEDTLSCTIALHSALLPFWNINCCSSWRQSEIDFHRLNLCLFSRTVFSLAKLFLYRGHGPYCLSVFLFENRHFLFLQSAFLQAPITHPSIGRGRLQMFLCAKKNTLLKWLSSCVFTFLKICNNTLDTDLLCTAPFADYCVVYTCFQWCH